jgi:SulP family sulfate permease
MRDSSMHAVTDASSAPDHLAARLALERTPHDTFHEIAERDSPPVREKPESRRRRPRWARSLNAPSPQPRHLERRNARGENHGHVIRFRPRLAETLPRLDRETFVADLVAGLSVGVLALPLAMAFAIASGLKPEAGLTTAIVAGFLISALGGTNLSIGGPTGAFVVVVYGVVERHGVANLILCTAIAGLMLVLMGVFRLGTLIRFVPHPVVVGFTNGIAVLIALAQVRDFLGLQIAKVPGEFFAMIETLVEALPTARLSSIALATTSLISLLFWPARLRQRVPPTLAVMVLATLAVWMFQMPVETIGDRFGSVPSSLPPPSWPAISPSDVRDLIAPASTIAILGALESLLCAVVADKLTHGRPTFARHDANQELMAQGLANIGSAIFGGMPATSAIARTTANVNNGGRTPLAGVLHALTLLGVMALLAPLAMHVPLAALASVLVAVALRMGEWEAFATLRRHTATRNAILLSVFTVTIVFDLTLAVQLGMLLAAVVFIGRITQTTRIEKAPPTADGVARYRAFGSLFFGSAEKLELALSSERAKKVALDLSRVIYLDTTALHVIESLHARFASEGRAFVLERVPEQPARILRASHVEDMYRDLAPATRNEPD